MLARMEVWLTSQGRAGLARGDYAILQPRFERLAGEAASVASLSQDLMSEMKIDERAFA